jgi:hypothetical protein
MPICGKTAAYRKHRSFPSLGSHRKGTTESKLNLFRDVGTKVVREMVRREELLACRDLTLYPVCWFSSEPYESHRDEHLNRRRRIQEPLDEWCDSLEPSLR